jgi:hypothetical protein
MFVDVFLCVCTCESIFECVQVLVIVCICV